MTKTIVTGVDSSQTALNAAEKAAALAEAVGGELHVCSAYRTSTADTLQSVTSREMGRTTSDAYQNLAEGQAKAAGDVAEAVAAVLRERHPSLTVEASAQEGTPAEVLLHLADKHDADTIVVGNKHVQGFARLLGSVAQKVASEANCDLHIVNTVHR